MITNRPLVQKEDQDQSRDRPVLLADGHIVDPASGTDGPGSLLVIDGKIAAIGPEVGTDNAPDGTQIIACAGLRIVPGLVDMQVFVGEPGAEHRETLATASDAAASGGVTTMITMPDTDPVIDDPALVDFVLRRARDTARVKVRPMAALTRGLEGAELSEFGLLREAGALAFTQGRQSLANSRVMRNALTYARDFGCPVVHLTEEKHLAADGVMNEGETATRLGLPGIPREAETIMLERDLRLVGLTNGPYHAAQISTEMSLGAIRRAKADGLLVTAGASIAHLTLNETDIGPYRTFFKFSPPLRSEDDRLALVAGLADGTLDIIVSAHDPQDVEGKRQPFAEAADGAIGLETLLAAGLRLVHSGEVELTRLIDALSTRPASILGLDAGTLEIGAAADIAVIDLETPWIMNEHEIRSRSANTAYENARFTGRVMQTYVDGALVYAHPDAPHYGDFDRHGAPQ